MTNEEIIKALRDMDEKLVEELEPKTRKLFDTIMSIADERDELRNSARTKEEIENKIAELYELASAKKIDLLRVIVTTDALSWVLGGDYLDTDIILGNAGEENGED